ncbi:MAG: hypothetical protein ABIF40_04285 [archaeon]
MDDEWEKYFGHIKEDDIKNEKPSKWKKPALILIGFFMVLLFVVAFAANGTIQNFFTNEIVSTKIQDNQAELNTVSLSFNGTTYDELLQIYLDNQETEVKVCLLGRVEDDTYIVTELYKPDQIKFFSSVHYTPCNLKTVVSLHTHPINECLPSNTDITSIKAYRIINPKVLGIVMCNTDRLVFY